jgi:hypothetical protein
VLARIPGSIDRWLLVAAHALEPYAERCRRSDDAFVAIRRVRSRGRLPAARAFEAQRLIATLEASASNGSARTRR